MNDRIVIDPKICHGKPVIRGTRLPVAIVVGSLAGGMTFDEVQREYGITSDDIRAALKFAGIDRNTPDPQGGKIDRDANGEPTGILRETAKDNVLANVPRPTAAQRRRALELALQDAPTLRLLWRAFLGHA